MDFKIKEDNAADETIKEDDALNKDAKEQENESLDSNEISEESSKDNTDVSDNSVASSKKITDTENPSKDNEEQLASSSADIKEESLPHLEKDNESKDKKSKENSVFNIYDIVSVFVSALVVIFLVFTFVGRNLEVSGESMMPTLNNGDRVAIGSLDRHYEYKDIVIVTQPNKLHKTLIKRVIAVGGQTVDIDDKNGVVIVDGKPLQEDYTLEPTYTKGDMDFPLRVPEGQLFVMGDNRNDSSDSRMKSIGLIDERYIMGKVAFRIAPFGHWKVN